MGLDLGFGGGSKSTTTSSSGTKTEQGRNFLDRDAGRDSVSRTGKVISDEAVDKIIQDVLGSASGLASLVGAQGSAGVFNSSASEATAGDFLSKVIGDIAELRAVDVTSEEASERENSQEDQEISGSSSSKGKTKDKDGSFSLGISF